jgi:rhomboid protease GluP
MTSREPERRVVFRSRDYRDCAEAALVLVALDIDHEIHHVDAEWLLTVPVEYAAAAEAELRSYLRESQGTRGSSVQPSEVGAGWSGLAVYVAVLLAVATAANQQLGGADWIGAGLVEAGRVRAGEWWRTVTALTLHADLTHLLGNLAFGSFFGHFVARHLGEGVGWAAVLLSGAGGNWLNAWIQPAAHRAIGASTAVFGALAILSAYSWRRGLYRHATRRARLGPIVAGIALLAFTGTGGENTDLVAHLTGFCVGLGLGAWLAHSAWIASAVAQRAAGLLALSILLSAWIVALAPLPAS